MKARVSLAAAEANLGNASTDTNLGFLCLAGRGFFAADAVIGIAAAVFEGCFGGCLTENRAWDRPIIFDAEKRGLKLGAGITV